MNVGIAHLAATVNTLVFAYLGSALPLLVLFSIQVRGLGFPLNEEIIAVEVVRALVGSIGIVLTVPITTAIAVRVARPRSVGPSRAGLAAGAHEARADARRAPRSTRRESRARWRRATDAASGRGRPCEPADRSSRGRRPPP